MVEFSLWSFPDFISIIIGITLAVFFFILPSDNKKANLFLALFLSSISFEVLEVLIEDISINGVYYRFWFQTSLFTVPFLYYYVKNCINQNLTQFDFLFLLPGILSNVLIFFDDHFLDIYLIQILEYIFNLSILLIIYSILRNHRSMIEDYYTELERKTLSWIKLILYLFLGFHLIWILEDIVSLESKVIAGIFPMISTLLTFATIFVLAYNGFSQPEIFKRRQFISLKNEAYFSLISKKQDLLYEISDLINKERLFLIQDLNLTMLAQKLHMKEKDLSGIINQQSGTSFYHFINDFRLKEFKRLLNSDKINQLSLLGLAQESGFKSKSTFYDFFKKVEGITPNQYKKGLAK